jgi:hypothetical protein
MHPSVAGMVSGRVAALRGKQGSDVSQTSKVASPRRGRGWVGDAQQAPFVLGWDMSELTRKERSYPVQPAGLKHNAVVQSQQACKCLRQDWNPEPLRHAMVGSTWQQE